MLIDYSRLLTNDSEHIDYERLEMIKTRASIEAQKQKEKNKYRYNETTLYLTKRADEFAYISVINRDLSEEEKALLSANIMFTSEKFVEILKSIKRDDYDTLKILIDIVTYIKRKLAETEVTDDIERSQKAAEKYARMLIKSFRTYIGNVSATQILNKIYEIITYEPTLLQNKTDGLNGKGGR